MLKQEPVRSGTSDENDGTSGDLALWLRNLQVSLAHDRLLIASDLAHDHLRSRSVSFGYRMSSHDLA